jgi:hypothetical protein
MAELRRDQTTSKAPYRVSQGHIEYLRAEREQRTEPVFTWFVVVTRAFLFCFSLLFFPENKKRLMRSPCSLCLSLPFQILNKSTDFHRISFQLYAIGADANLVVNILRALEHLRGAY